MANTIKIKNSGTASNTPNATSLEYGELALNYTDGKLYFKNSASTVDFFSTGGGTVGGSANQIVYKNSSNVSTGSANLTFDGTTLSGVSAVFSGSSSSDLLRITQTGAGNALVVEDSTNPDSTPFVIFNDGKVAIGSTFNTGNSSLDIFSDTSLGLNIRSAGSSGGRIIAQRSAGTVASPTAVAVDNILGQLRCDGYDGTSYLQAANINFAVDGTVSTGTVPGRIIFSTGTTGTTTERMRIDSAGQVGIGGTPTAGRTLSILKNMTGSTSTRAIQISSTVMSDSTTDANVINTFIGTEAASFTIGVLRHFFAEQTTLGSGSAITTQIGFAAGSSLTGATNNYGFVGNLAAGTNRWNLYMGGTANNYMAGALGIGSNALTGYLLRVFGNVTGATTAYAVRTQPTVQSDVTAAAVTYDSTAGTQAAAFTLTELHHFRANQSTFGASSTVTTQIGFSALSSLTGAANNYGFYGGIASGTGRYNLYMAGTADNYLAGRLGVGSVSLTTTNLLVSPTITGGTTARNIHSSGQVQSDVTTLATYYSTNALTQATAFTLANLRHYTAQQGTFGAGSAVTTQVGFYVENTLIGATNNYAFQSEIASGTNRFNLYMSGTAANYLAGRLGVGATLTSGAMAQVTNTTAADKVLVVKGAASQSGNYFEAQNSAGTALIIADLSGRFVVGHSAAITASGANTTPLQTHSTSVFQMGLSTTLWSANATGVFVHLSKSRGASIGTRGVVSSGDAIGRIIFDADDGTNFIPAAMIGAEVDGTPGTGDMPGRLLFLTTADGASSVTERMRIDSAGQVGIGTTPVAGRTLTVAKAITGSTQGIGIIVGGPVQSDVTAGVNLYRTAAQTQDAVFTLASLRHFLASQSTLGASSTVAEQIGFLVDSTLTGATNNFGFVGQMAAGTNRWNLYMGGTANNYLAGRLGVGENITSGTMAQVVNTTAADKVLVVKGAASQTGTLFEVQNSAGTRLVEITSAGAVGIGGTPTAGRSLAVSSNITGSTTSRGITSIGTIQSDVTGAASYFATSASVINSAFTLGTLQHYVALQGTFGASSAVTNQIGFHADDTLIGATNNYGFYGEIASGTNRWNLYMAGTAANYLAGRLGVGATLTSGAMAQIVNTTNTDIGLIVKGASSQSGDLQQWQNSSGTVLAEITSSGKLIAAGIDGGTP